MYRVTTRRSTPVICCPLLFLSFAIEFCWGELRKFPSDPVLCHHVPLLNEAVAVCWCRLLKYTPCGQCDAAETGVRRRRRVYLHCAVLSPRASTFLTQISYSHSRNTHSVSQPTKLRWSTVFWDVTPCSPAEVQDCLLGLLFDPEDGDVTFLQTVGGPQPEYTPSHSARWHCM
jgi:hypothetical protein